MAVVVQAFRPAPLADRKVCSYVAPYWYSANEYSVSPAATSTCCLPFTL